MGGLADASSNFAIDVLGEDVGGFANWFQDPLDFSGAQHRRTIRLAEEAQEDLDDESRVTLDADIAADRAEELEVKKFGGVQI